MSLSPELASALDAGEALLVPSRARVLALRHAWTERQLAAGCRSWTAPDILTPAAWLQSLTIEGRLPAMSPALEWLCLRAVAAETADAAAPNALADAWQRSLQRVRDHGIDWRRLEVLATPETNQLRHAHQSLLRRAAELGNLVAPSTLRWSDLPAGRSRTAVGFSHWPAAWASRLRALPTRTAASCRDIGVVAAESPAAEVEAAVEWAVARLDARPSERCLLLIPPGRDYDHALQRSLDRHLRFEDGREAALHLGRTRMLSQSPAVKASLFWLEVLTRPCAPERLCEGMREHGRVANQGLAGARLAARLRPRLRHDARYADWLVIARGRDANPDPEIESLLQALAAAHRALQPTPRVEWAERMASASLALPVQWHIGTVDGGQMLRKAWQELLFEYAQWVELGLVQSQSEGIGLLAARAARTSWPEPADDSRLHVLRSFDDPILQYDALWVCGLSAAQWPAAAQADAWIPRVLQQEHGLPAADAEGRLREARHQLHAWRVSATDLRLSYPAMLDEHAASPSPLLRGLPTLSPPTRSVAVAQTACEQVADTRYTRELHGLVAHGGRAINRFNDCPFKGSADLRLGVPDERAAVPGFDALASGQLAHRALYGIWSELRGSEGLQKLHPSSQPEFVRRHLLAVLRAESSSTMDVLPASLSVEVERQQQRLGRLLDAERQRRPFVVESLEEAHILSLAGRSLALRIDRVDQMLDAAGQRFPGRLIIDYKSGRSGQPAWHKEPRRELQLLLYREALLASARPVDGVVTWELDDEQLEAAGAIAPHLDLPAVLKPKPVIADWSASGDEWSQWVLQCATGLWRGDAEATPQALACKHCALTMLCRRLDAGPLLDGPDTDDD